MERRMLAKRRGAISLPLVFVVAACSEPTAPGPPAPPQFGSPVELGPPVNSPGWEDSGFISPDGRYFYFTYLRIDPLALIQSGSVVVRGPLRPGWDPADTLAAKLYRAENVAGVWTEPQSLGLILNIPKALNGGAWFAADGNRTLFTDPLLQPARPEPTIYFAEKNGEQWTAAVPAARLGYPFLPGDENPHLTLDEGTLFFESSRPGGRGGPDLWMSTKGPGGWGPPVNLGSAINTAGTEGSPFSLDGTELYFDDKGGGKGISWSVRRADGSWTSPVVVLAGVFGDPSLTRAGNLYVIGGTIVGGIPDANAYLARRR